MAYLGAMDWLYCNTCSIHCPMSLPVEEMVDQKNMECILCGNCVDVCRQGAITYDWGKNLIQTNKKD